MGNSLPILESQITRQRTRYEAPLSHLAGSFFGASYNRLSGETKVWVDGNVVWVKNIGKYFELGTQNNVRMGARKSNGSYFKGRISRMQVYNLALTQGQIQAIQDQVLRPDKNASHSCCCCCCCCCYWSGFFLFLLLLVCLCFFSFFFFVTSKTWQICSLR